MSAQALLPLPSGEDGIIRITAQQLGPVLQAYRTMFQIVRLVDPGICVQISTDQDGQLTEDCDHCYVIWKKHQRCQRCISQEVLRLRKPQNKVEAIGNDVYYVLAMFAEVDGVPYSIECVNPIQATGTDLENENLLNQLLLRNRQVYTDSATKVFNRRYYDERLRGLTGQYAMAMIDIDNFKQINDRFGHLAGDAALSRVAQTIRSMLRTKDELVRYGGDEFFLLFHGLPVGITERKLQEICRAVRELRLAEYPELRLSISVGGLYAAGRIADLIHKADQALYQAKKTKDCVILIKEAEE